MRVATPNEMREIDKLAVSLHGIPLETLMENAGIKSFELISKRFPKTHKPLVLVGPGNNGGDALVVARHFIKNGIIPEVMLLDDGVTSKLAQKQFELFIKSGGETKPFKLSIFKVSLVKSDLVVDGLFGTGLSREISGLASEAIKIINNRKTSVVSLDIPSGVDGYTGFVKGEAIKADVTVAFGLAKLGLITGLGPKYSGEVHVVDIGIPRTLLLSGAKVFVGVTGKMAAPLLPKSHLLGNKSKNGRCLMVAGSPGMWGAGVLAGSAAYRIGAGYVTALVDTASRHESFARVLGPEFLTTTLDEVSSVSKYDSIVIGPGSGKSELLTQTIRKVLDLGIKNVVLDADGLMALTEMSIQVPADWILTPHSGELGRLLGLSSEEVDSDRARAVQNAVKKFGCHILLKGWRTLVGSPNGKIYILLSGNPTLAKAGSGDVLSGIVAGLLAQGVTPLRAAVSGAYFHGWLADRWVLEGRDSKSLVAKDLLEMIPLKLKEFRKSYDLE